MSKSNTQIKQEPLPEQDQLLQDEEILSPEEQKELAGYENDVPIKLDEEYRLDLDEEDPEPRKASERGTTKLAVSGLAIGGLMVLLAGFWWIFASNNSGSDPVARPERQEQEPVVDETPENEAAKLRARIAYLEQEEELNKEPEARSPARLQPKNEEQKPESKAPETVPSPAPEPKAPPEPEVITRTVTRTVEKPVPVRVPAKSSPAPRQVEPQRPQIIAPPEPSPSPTLPASPPPEIEEVPPSPEPIDPRERWSELASLGTMTLSQQVETPVASAPRDLLLNENDNATRSREQVNSDNTITVGEEPPTNSRLSPGEAGILQRNVNFQGNEPVRIAIGTSASGKVSIPLAADINSSNTAYQRFGITLTEDLTDNDGGVALPEGTLIIAEATQISDSMFVEATAVAIAYKKNGRLVTERIDKNAIIVKGANFQPLIASSLGDTRAIAPQDITASILSAVGNVGEKLSEPETISSITTSSNGTTTSTTSSSQPDSQILPAILEGFFTPLSETLRQSASRQRQEKESLGEIAMVKKGTLTTVVVNQPLTRTFREF